MSGAILYEGPSMLDGEMIVAVATEHSDNRKTGAMTQVWILRADRAPLDAARDGSDASVCGACPLRATVPGTLKGRACYVNLGQAPQGVWRAFQRGSYPSVPYAQLSTWGKGRNLRLGAYGDPAAIPFRVWDALLSQASGHTGYTHQAAHPRFDARLLTYVMRSTEGESPRAGAGRTFRVRPAGAPLHPGEIDCPNVTRGVQCVDCQLCQGTSKAGKNISIEAHGSGAKWVQLSM